MRRSHYSGRDGGVGVEVISPEQGEAMGRDATVEEIDEALERVGASAAETKRFLRELSGIIESSKLSMTFSRMVRLDGDLGALEVISRGSKR